MIIIGIDTSCDDTCVSVVEIKGKKPVFKIISNIVSSQAALHAEYGGVYPSLAKREHQKNLPTVFKKATKGTDISKIDFIAVTSGPGLEPCLWQGITFAEELAKRIKKSLIPVNHIEGHILANFLPEISEISNFQFPISKKINFPAVCLAVSGGHTQLILIKNIGKYKLIGETRDDAAGECLDKAARILGLGYPGGPIVAKLATKIKNQISKIKIHLPRPMIYHKNYDFSFSGLKTAVLYDVKSRSKRIRKSEEYIRGMCVEVQQAVIDVLIHKTMKAAEDNSIKTIILGGGVSANTALRKQFALRIKKQMPKVKLFVPKKQFCTDNAAMIAVAAYFQIKSKKPKRNGAIKADSNLRV